MAVAVHLIETLTLITIIGILLSSTIIVVMIDRIFSFIFVILKVIKYYLSFKINE